MVASNTVMVRPNMVKVLLGSVIPSLIWMPTMVAGSSGEMACMLPMAVQILQRAPGRHGGCTKWGASRSCPARSQALN